MIEHVIFLAQAERDVADAHEWYEQQQPGLGVRFIATVDERIDWIKKNSLMSEVVHKDYRRALMPPFPYAIIYRVDDDQLTVNSVFHCSLDPRRLRNRLR